MVWYLHSTLCRPRLSLRLVLCRPLLHGALEIDRLMGVHDVLQRDPMPKVILRVDRRISEDWPPEPHIEVRGYSPDLGASQALPATPRLPLPGAAEKKSPNTSLSTKATTGMMAPKSSVKSPSRSITS